MTRILECPCCSYFPVVPTSWIINDIRIWKCMNCAAEFREDNGELVFYVLDDGDDHEQPDDLPDDTRAWLAGNYPETRDE